MVYGIQQHFLLQFSNGMRGISVKYASLVLSLCVLLFAAAEGRCMTLEEYRQKVLNGSDSQAFHEEALRAAGNDPEYKAQAYFWLANRQYGLGRYPEARAIAEKALRELPEKFRARAYANLCMIAVSEKNPEEARRYLALAAGHIPDPVLQQRLRAQEQDIVHSAVALAPRVLRQAFEIDREAAEKKYVGKQVVLCWNISFLDSADPVNPPVIVGFNSYNDRTRNTDVACIIRDEDMPLFKKLKILDSVIVIGTCLGQYRDLLVIGDCHVIEKPKVLETRVRIGFTQNSRSPHEPAMRRAYTIVRGLYPRPPE